MEIIRAALGIKEGNTVHHWAFHVFPPLVRRHIAYWNLATVTEKPGHHKEQEVQLFCLSAFSVSYMVFFFSPPWLSSLFICSHLFPLTLLLFFCCFSLTFMLSHTRPPPSLTLCNPPSTSLTLLPSFWHYHACCWHSEQPGRFSSLSTFFFFLVKKGPSGVKSSCGLPAAAGKIHSRNLGHADSESERRDTGPELPGFG